MTTARRLPFGCTATTLRDRKSTRLNSSHSQISYAVFCLKKKKNSPHAQRAQLKRRTVTIRAVYERLELLEDGHTESRCWPKCYLDMMDIVLYSIIAEPC